MKQLVDLEVELNDLVEKRSSLRFEADTITSDIMQVRKNMTLCSPDENRSKWQAALKREREAKSEMKILRYKLYKALKMLGCKNGESAEMCGISKHRAPELRDGLRRMENSLGDFLPGAEGGKK